MCKVIENRRIRQNAWGNWYGYIGRRRVIAFGDSPVRGAEAEAERWLSGSAVDVVCNLILREVCK